MWKIIFYAIPLFFSFLLTINVRAEKVHMTGFAEPCIPQQSKGEIAKPKSKPKSEIIQVRGGHLMPDGSFIVIKRSGEVVKYPANSYEASEARLEAGGNNNRRRRIPGRPEPKALSPETKKRLEATERKQREEKRKLPLY